MAGACTVQRWRRWRCSHGSADTPTGGVAALVGGNRSAVRGAIRVGAGSGSARVLSAGLGNRNNSLNVVTSQGTVGIRENERTEGNESILHIVKHVCRVHGIDLEAVKLLDSSMPNRTSQTSQSEVEDEPNEELAPSLQEPFGWPELQIDIIREAIGVAEALPGSCVDVSVRCHWY